MTTIQAGLTYYKQVNEKVREAAEKDDSITIENVIGQRYIGCGSSGKNITVHGTPGNGLGQYLNGSTLEVFGNAQEAVGDTMNEGDIIIHGNVGDACGYGMRGGRIFIEGDCGYRGGIHMKAYHGALPHRRHRRQGRLVPRRVPGRWPHPRSRHRSERRISGQQFLRNGYARRQNCVKM